MNDRTLPQGPPPAVSARQFSFSLYRSLRMKFALGVLVVAVISGVVLWIKNNLLVIDPGKGAPIGLAVRTDKHIATLIRTLEPYTPSLHRDHSKDTYRVSIFLVPLDGSPTRHIPITGGKSPNSLSLAKVLGSDGHTLWFDAEGLGGVDLATWKLRTEAEVRKATTIPQPMRSKTSPFGPKPENYFAAGLFVAADRWLGLHSVAEAARDFRPKSRLKRVVSAEDAKQMRQLHRGVLDPDSIDSRYQILTMTPIGIEQYLNAAFFRMDDTQEPLQVADPVSVLMAYTSAPGLGGKLMVARVDLEGALLWQVDTGIDRFHLEQVLPGADSMAFVGKRPAVPDKVSEPLLVIVDNRTGAIVTHSLWR